MKAVFAIVAACAMIASASALQCYTQDASSLTALLLTVSTTNNIATLCNNLGQITVSQKVITSTYANGTTYQYSGYTACEKYGYTSTITCSSGQSRTVSGNDGTGLTTSCNGFNSQTSTAALNVGGNSYTTTTTSSTGAITGTIVVSTSYNNAQCCGDNLCNGGLGFNAATTLLANSMVLLAGLAASFLFSKM